MDLERSPRAEAFLLCSIGNISNFGLTDAVLCCDDLLIVLESGILFHPVLLSVLLHQKASDLNLHESPWIRHGNRTIAS